MGGLQSRAAARLPARNKRFSFTRQEALRLVDLAAEAVAIVDRLDEDARLKLATRLVPRTRKTIPVQ